RKARDRAFGTSDSKRSAQFGSERELYAKKMQAFEAAQQLKQQPASGQQAPTAQPSTGHPLAQQSSVLQPAAPRPGARPPLAMIDLPGPRGPVSVQVLIDDITTQDVDVLVNSTNRRL